MQQRDLQILAWLSSNPAKPLGRAASWGRSQTSCRCLDCGTCHSEQLVARGRTFILDHIDELTYAFDLAIHTAQPGRSRAIDRYAQSNLPIDATIMIKLIDELPRHLQSESLEVIVDDRRFAETIYAHRCACNQDGRSVCSEWSAISDQGGNVRHRVSPLDCPTRAA